MNMKTKCTLTFLAISLVAYGHSGPYDRWLNMFLSSFVLSPYMTIIGEWLWLLGALILLVFWIFYFTIVIDEDKYKRWLSGIKALYFYLIASVGEIVGLVLYCVSCETKWFK